MEGTTAPQRSALRGEALQDPDTRNSIYIYNRPESHRNINSFGPQF